MYLLLQIIVTHFLNMRTFIAFLNKLLYAKSIKFSKQKIVLLFYIQT